MLRRLIDRLLSETPTYFKKIRNTSILLGGATTIILASPIAVPLFFTTIAPYIITASTVAAFLSQSSKHKTEE